MDYIAELREMLAKEGEDFEGRKIGSLLEELYFFYTGFHGLDTQKIQSCNAELDSYIGHLCYQKRNRISEIINELCAEQDRIAFLIGAKTGACLVLELMDK